MAVSTTAVIRKLSVNLKKVKTIDKIDLINRLLRVITIKNVFLLIISVKTISYITIRNP